MRTQAECWQALLEGKTLVDQYVKIKLVNGLLYNIDADCETSICLTDPENWSIYNPEMVIKVDGMEIPEPIRTVEEVNKLEEVYIVYTTRVQCYKRDGLQLYDLQIFINNGKVFSSLEKAEKAFQVIKTILNRQAVEK